MSQIDPTKQKIYINDVDFMQENDWSVAFELGNIEFVHSIIPKTFAQTKELLKLYNGEQITITPLPSSFDDFIYYSRNYSIYFNVGQLSIEQIFLLSLSHKSLNDDGLLLKGYTPKNDFENSIITWAGRQGKESFNEFTNRQYENTKDFLSFPNRILLKQKPNLNKISAKENLTFLK